MGSSGNILKEAMAGNDLVSKPVLLDQLSKYFFLHDGGNFMEVLKKVANAPAVDAVSRAVFEQILWERDTAFRQLTDHGIPFGGTAPDVVKVLLCAFCAKFDTSGYDNSNEDDFLLHTGYCKHWGKSTQGCGFCDRRERRADDGSKV